MPVALLTTLRATGLAAVLLLTAAGAAVAAGPPTPAPAVAPAPADAAAQAQVEAQAQAQAQAQVEAQADAVTRAQAAETAAQAEVGQLQADVERSAAELTEGTVRLEAGRARLATVQAEAVRVRRAADAAVARAAAAKNRLAEMVGAAYRAPFPGDVSLALAAAPGRLADAYLASADLDHVRGNQQDALRAATAEGVSASELVERADTLEAEAQAVEQQLASDVFGLQQQAVQTRIRLEAAADRLQAAQVERQAAQVKRQAAVDEAARLQAARQAAADAAAARNLADRERAAALSAATLRAATLRAAALKAAALSAAETRVAALAAVDSGGALCVGGTDGYANGFLPAEALCPLTGFPGHRLRADAAAAFNAMAATGPLCITDSYRSYGAQVDVFARKPDLAAVPGTSNHGLGIAIDFGCGAERFGSDAYLWLKANGPIFGWTHPAWAEPGGGRPEPWHWEFTGTD